MKKSRLRHHNKILLKNLEALESWKAEINNGVLHDTSLWEKLTEIKGLVKRFEADLKAREDALLEKNETVKLKNLQKIILNYLEENELMGLTVGELSESVFDDIETQLNHPYSKKATLDFDETSEEDDETMRVRKKTNE